MPPARPGRRTPFQPDLRSVTLGKLINWDKLLGHWHKAWTWFQTDVLTLASLVQILTIGGVFLGAWLVGRPLKHWLNWLLNRQAWTGGRAGRYLRQLISETTLILAVASLWVATGVGKGLTWHVPFVEMAAALTTAWVVIRLAASVVRDPHWARFIAVLAWTIAALHVVGLLGYIVGLLDSLAITLGQVRISALAVIKGIIVLTLLLKLATGAGGLLERRIYTLTGLTPSVQVLMSKALKITLFTVAILVSLSAVGVNLSAFAFVGGAIGVGLGFGLQKVVSNLVSGVIILMDRSVKPGDVIEVGQTYGKIKSLGARYVSVITRDGTEYLIPNENLITNQVINWSFSGRDVRLKLPVGVAYDTDVTLAMDLMITAAAETPRVLTEPGPRCQLKNFGDNAIELELRLWISDPENGISNVRSEVRLNIWQKFKDHGIEIPFPQRDVHIKIGGKEVL
jgi:small-conductance mechanosensitive channel